MPAYATPLILHPPADMLEKHPDIRRAAQDLSRQYAAHKMLVTDEQLQSLGSALWQCLEADAELHAAKQQAGTLPLPLMIKTDDPALQVLPWESLHHPEHGFLGRENGFALSRCAATPPTLPALQKGPLRVLLFTSLPNDVDAEKARIDTENEQAQVLEALNPHVQQGTIELDVPDTGDFAKFQRLLQTGNYALVFLSGHGTFHFEPLSDEPPYAVFQFEDAQGHSRFVRDVDIAKSFIHSGVQCVVLSACESSKSHASADLHTGLAQRLAAQGVPHVVGMRESVLDRAGILFSRAFCDAIARRERVDGAVQAGRAAITQPLRDATWRDGESHPCSTLSLGQWTLPQLLSHAPERALIDWDFVAQPMQAQAQYSRVLNIAGIPVPELYIGRRQERHHLLQALQQQPQLLITGAGGQGKTALLAYLAQRLEAQGYHLYAYCAREDHAWEDFLFQAQISLEPDLASQYNSQLPLCDTPQKHAQLFLTLLSKQHDKILLILDNLESLQAPDSHALQHDTVAAWIASAQRLRIPLLLTSRWCLPDWPLAHHALQPATYGDFLRYVQQRGLVLAREHLRQVYTVLGGNFRGLEFFAKASPHLDTDQQKAFLARLDNAQQELQTDMAIALVYSHLPAEAQSLLAKLSAYSSPVLFDGAQKLCGDWSYEQVHAALSALLAVSLLDNNTEQAPHYQCAPQVSDWLHAQGLRPALPTYQLAAEYQQFVFEHHHKTLDQALNTHQALQAAQAFEAARVFAMDHLVEYFLRKGLYHPFVQDWLPDLLKAETPKLQGDVLNQAGRVYYYIGDYDTALDFLQRSLAIRQDIGDKSGEGTTLNNISQIFKARGDYDSALDFLQRSLAIQQDIGEKSGEGTTLNNMATIAHARGDYDSALDYLQRALAIQQDIGDQSGEGTTLNNMSQIFQARGDYDSALDYLQRALVIAQDIGDKSSEGRALNNISQIFKARGDYDSALDFLQRSLIIFQDIGNQSAEGTTLNNISQIYDARGDYDSALDYLQRALMIAQDIGDQSGEGTTLNNISLIFKARGDYDSALDFLQRSLAIRQDIGDGAGVCGGLINWGVMLFEQGSQQEGLARMTQAYVLAKRIGYAQVLQALESIGKQLGGKTGLDVWEQLAAQRDEEGAA